MTDPRLEVLRDALIEGRDDQALVLIKEIADGIKRTPLERLVTLRWDVLRETAEQVRISVEIPQERVIDMVEHISPGTDPFALVRGTEYGARWLDLSDGIRIVPRPGMIRRSHLDSHGIDQPFMERPAPRLSPEGQATYDDLIARFGRDVRTLTCSACGAVDHEDINCRVLPPSDL